MAETQDCGDAGTLALTSVADLQVATSKPHTPAREDSPQGWQLSSHLHQAKETAAVGTGKLFQPTARHQAVPNNCLCLRLSKSGSGAEELQYKMLVSRSKPWGQYTNLQLTITKDRALYGTQMFHFTSSHYIKSCLIHLRNAPRHFPLSFPSIWA